MCTHTPISLVFIWAYVVSVIVVACSLCVFLSMYVLCSGDLFVECVCYICG